MKSDTNALSQYGVIAGFRVWPISPTTMVWRENRTIAVKVAGVPAPNDKIIYTVTGSPSNGISALPTDGGITVTAGAASASATFTIGAYDVDAKATAAPTTFTVNVYQPLTITGPTAVTGNAGYPVAQQISFVGGNGGPVTFSTTADPQQFVVSTSGQLNWTSTTAASPINGNYSNLTPYQVPVKLSQPGFPSTTATIPVTLYSSLRFIKPAQPPYATENLLFDVGTYGTAQVQAVGGNPSSTIAMTISSSNFSIGSATNNSGISSANISMSTRSTPGVDLYSIPATLSGAGWPITMNFTLSAAVRPIVNDPGTVYATNGTASSTALSCTCTGATSPTFRFDSFSTSGISISSSGTLSWTSSLPTGTYLIPVTVTARGSSGALVTSATRVITLMILDPLKLIAPTSATFDYGVTTPAATLQATGGNPSGTISLSTTSTNFSIGTPTSTGGVTSATFAPKSGSLPGVGQSSVPITLFSANSPSSVTTNLTTRIRPVLNNSAFNGMNSYAGSASLTSACACTGATSTQYSIASGFGVTGISLSTSGLLSWSASVPVGTYNIPVIVSAANTNGIFVDSATTTMVLKIVPALLLTSPTSTQTGVAATATTFSLIATGGNGTSATFKIQSGYAFASSFTATTNTAGFDGSNLTSYGNLSYSSSLAAGTYQVPIALSGAGAPADISAGTITVTIRPALAVSSATNASCQTFNATAWGSAMCSLTITYSSGSGMGQGFKITNTPTGTYGFSWSTSNTAVTTSVPFPSLGGITGSTTLYFWKNSTGFCSSTRQSSGSVSVTVVDPASPSQVTLSVAVKC